ncbi:hypothetical protein ABKN59_002504 [Abortiporus biennis]
MHVLVVLLCRLIPLTALVSSSSTTMSVFRLFLYHSCRVWFTCAQYIVLNLFRTYTLLLLRSLTHVLEYTESVAGLIFEIICTYLSVPPCGVYNPQESAVVISGGGEDVGHMLALKFSELGYTVFTLHSSSQQYSTQSTSNSPITSSANLLYAWHKKKEKSAMRNWGLIAPVILDSDTIAQRARASETVKAYSEAYTQSNIKGSRNNHHERWSSRLKRPSELQLTEALMWSDTITQCIREPVLSVQDYTEMLSDNRGRVIFLSTFPQDRPFRFSIRHAQAVYDVQDLVTGYLSHQLEDYGIRVSSIISGPVGMVDEDPESNDSSSCSKRKSRQVRGLAANDIARSVDVTQALLCVLQDIVISRYPKDSYTIGLHPFIGRIMSIAPAIVQRIIARLSST